MGSIGTILAQTGNMTVLSAERLLGGITQQTFARFARPGGVELHSNHPAFILGHLSLYPARVLTHVGRPPGEAAPPARYDELFKNGVECRDDPTGTIYPPMAEMREFFFRSYRAALAAIAEADDARLAGPNPSEGRMKELFPTLGSMLNFYLSGHAHSHLGQLSPWRCAPGPAAGVTRLLFGKSGAAVIAHRRSGGGCHAGDRVTRSPPRPPLGGRFARGRFPVPDQLDLFDFRRRHEPKSKAADAVAAAAVEARLAGLAASLPSNVYLGTSSWSFPGWRGIVYDREVSEQTLARHGLSAYARHPLLRMVGIDRTYYAPITTDQFAGYAETTPPGFRFLVKAHDLCLLPTFGAKNRYNRKAREANPTFLDPIYAAEQVIRPAVEGLREKLGPIVFQFTPLNLRPLGGPNAFIERLRTFLLALPRGPLYSVEIRNEDLLTDRYLDALDDAAAANCYTVHPKMPSIAEQAAITRERSFPAIVVRWMLGGDQEYETARDRYAPFDKLVDEDPANRDAIARLCVDAIAKRTPVYTIANNKAEGSAPLTIFKLADRIVTIARTAGRISIE